LNAHTVGTEEKHSAARGSPGKKKKEKKLQSEKGRITETPDRRGLVQRGLVGGEKTRVNKAREKAPLKPGKGQSNLKNSQMAQKERITRKNQVCHGQKENSSRKKLPHKGRVRQGKSGRKKSFFHARLGKRGPAHPRSPGEGHPERARAWKKGVLPSSSLGKMFGPPKPAFQPNPVHGKKTLHSKKGGEGERNGCPEGEC